MKYKDANECLQAGVAKTEMDLAIETAVEIRPERLRGIYDFEDGIWQKFHPTGAEQLGWVLPWGNQHGSSLPFRWRVGEVTIASGHNGHGKSQVLNHIVVDLGWQGVRSLVCSMEMTAPETYRRLIRIATGEAKPAGTEDAPLPRVEFVEKCLRPLADKVWVYDHVGMADLNEVLEVALYARRRYDIRFLVIDSLMTLKVEVEDNKYAEQKTFMNKLCEFASKHGIHVVLVAHAKKLDTRGNKEHAIPRKYDIAGSADLSNLAWNVMITWRNKKKEEELRELQEEIARKAGKGLEFWQLSDAEQEQAITSEQRANLVRLMELHDAYILIDKQRGGEGDEPVRKTWFHRKSLQYIERPIHQGGQPRKYTLEKAAGLEENL